MTIVANNNVNANVNNNDNDNANGVERSDSASPVANAKVNAATTVDLLEQPYGNLERAFQAKQRNLEKRRLKLQQKSEQASKGAPLTKEQREALSKAREVDQQIEYVKELSKLLEKQQKLYQRARKDALRKQKLLWAAEKAEKTVDTTPTPPPSETDKASVSTETETANDSSKVDDDDVEKPTEEVVTGSTEPVAVVTHENPTDTTANQENETAKPDEKTSEVQGNFQPKALANDQEGVLLNGNENGQPPATVDEAQPTANPTNTTADGGNRRSHHHNRRSGYKRDYNNGRPFHPRGNRHQRSSNGRRPSNSVENGHAADGTADSSEGEFVKPTTFVRRRNVEGGHPAEVNGEEPANGRSNGHRGYHNYHNEGRPAYRKPHRGHHSPQANNGAPAANNGNGPIENRFNEPAQNGQYDGQAPRPHRHYANNGNGGYRGPPLQFNNSNNVNGNGRPYRPRPSYGNGNGRNYEENNDNNNNGNYNNDNGNNNRAPRSNYYKQTAAHRQPLECGFVFAAN